jgi:hypothetical protein
MRSGTVRSRRRRCRKVRICGIALQSIALAAGMLWLGASDSHVARGRAAVIVSNEAETTTNRRLVVELAEKERLPAMYPYREFLQVGG